MFLFDVIKGIALGRKSTMLYVLVWVSQHAEAETGISVLVVYLRGDPRKHREGVGRWLREGRKAHTCCELVTTVGNLVLSSTHLRSVPLRSEESGVFIHQLAPLTDRK